MRLRLAWKLLRGQSVMYKCVMVVTPTRDRIYVGSTSDPGHVHVVGNRAFRQGSACGEVYVFDFATGMAYPLYVDGELP